MYSYASQIKARILLVDDDLLNLKVVSKMLEGDGIEILTARSGEEAIKVALNNELALILMDVQMPGMNGYEVTAFLKANPLTKYIPIIFVTGNSNETEHVLKGYSEGAIDYLHKPVNPHVTKAKVRSYLIQHTQRKELEQKDLSLENLGVLVNNSADIMCMLVADNLILEEINPACKIVLDYDLEEIKGSKVSDYFSKEDLLEISKLCSQTIKKDGLIINYENKVKCKDGSMKWLSWSAAYKNGRWFINAKDITEQKIVQEQLMIKTRQLEDTNREIKDSINYAKLIQDASLPPVEALQRLIPHSFIFFQPKDTVSGDFYWFAQAGEAIIVAVVDCTGHGVPGALLSMMGTNLLQQIVIEEKNTSPANILTQLNSKLHERLNKNNVKEGMDIALCALYPDKNELYFAGANRPLFHIRKSALTKLKPDKRGIGGHTPSDYIFTEQKLDLLKDDRFYIFSDGFGDQFGGELDKKFSSKQFGELLMQTDPLPAEVQKETIYKAMQEWKGDNEQTDDVLIIGFKHT